MLAEETAMLLVATAIIPDSAAMQVDSNRHPRLLKLHETGELEPRETRLLLGRAAKQPSTRQHTKQPAARVCDERWITMSIARGTILEHVRTVGVPNRGEATVSRCTTRLISDDCTVLPPRAFNIRLRPRASGRTKLQHSKSTAKTVMRLGSWGKPGQEHQALPAGASQFEAQGWQCMHPEGEKKFASQRPERKIAEPMKRSPFGKGWSFTAMLGTLSSDNPFSREAGHVRASTVRMDTRGVSAKTSEVWVCPTVVPASWLPSESCNKDWTQPEASKESLASPYNMRRLQFDLVSNSFKSMFWICLSRLSTKKKYVLNKWAFGARLLFFRIAPCISNRGCESETYKLHA